MIAVLLAAVAAQAGSPIASDTRQLVLVVADDWNAPRATLTLWTRDGGRWKPGAPAVDVVLGRAGLGWGRGLHAADLPRALGGPEKREGDGRAPAGAFALLHAFGYDARPPDGTLFPYHASPRRQVCVDDPRSPRYNQLAIPPAGQKAPWRSAEPMRLHDDDYRLGIVVAHNTSPAVPGAGSCIFLHIASPPDEPTAGCTAMLPDAMAAVIRWLRPAARPTLVQLPRAAYEKLAASWQLPAFTAIAR